MGDSKSLGMTNGPSNERAAKEGGCLCEWWGGGSIVRFHRACPLLHLHWVPTDREVVWLDDDLVRERVGPRMLRIGGFGETSLVNAYGARIRELEAAIRAELRLGTLSPSGRERLEHALKGEAARSATEGPHDD